MSVQSVSEQKWRKQADIALEASKKLPPGPERDALVKRARQLATASEMNAWLSSPGLQSPK